MTELQHTYVQRDLAALQAAQKKLDEAKEKFETARIAVDDAERAFGHAQTRFHETAQAAMRLTSREGHYNCGR
jgi:prefoldin subunit 5